MTAFHLESFATFYTDTNLNTVVTCLLTTRHYILSNMQYQLLQLLQLMQFWTTASFSLKLTNSVVGSEVMINHDSINGYASLGFDMSNFNEDGSGDVFTVGTCKPIRIVQVETPIPGQNTPNVYFLLMF